MLIIAITLGTGVGSGIIVDGHILNGANFAAGEMGHMVIVVDGEQCNCGRRGCWERYASATALIAQTKDEMRHAQDSMMWELVDNNIDAVNGRTAFDAMRKGDVAGKRVVDRYIYYVACGIINFGRALMIGIVWGALIGGTAMRRKRCWSPFASMSVGSATVCIPPNRREFARQSWEMMQA